MMSRASVVRAPVVVLAVAGMGLAVAAASLTGCKGSGGSRPAATAPSATTTSGSTTTGGSSSAVIASGTLSALTYNVAGLPQGISSSQPSTYTSLISPLLNGYDLVLVQEDFFYHTDLQRDVRHSWRSTPLSGATALANDGLNRFSQSRLFDFDRQRWGTCNGFFSNANDCLAAKGFSVARHEIAPGVVIDVYNLHADAGGSSGDIAARAFQFGQLKDYILSYSAGHAVIVGGDTNLGGFDPDDEPVLRDFMDRVPLRDACRTLGQGPDTIDRFFFRNGSNVQVEPVSWRIATEFTTASGQPLSDHDAIHVNFEWRLMR